MTTMNEERAAGPTAMTDLPRRLRIKASMIALGERIAWGSDIAIMEEAADTIEALLAAAPAHPVERQEHGEVQRLREALDRAVEICREQGRHWDSDDVIADRNYADHCADLIEQLRAAIAASTALEVE